MTNIYGIKIEKNNTDIMKYFVSKGRNSNFKENDCKKDSNTMTLRLLPLLIKFGKCLCYPKSYVRPYFISIPSSIFFISSQKELKLFSVQPMACTKFWYQGSIPEFRVFSLWKKLKGPKLQNHSRHAIALGDH